MKNLILILIVSLFFVSCAHHPDVRPGVDGVHRVSIRTDDKESGSREAIRQANSFCEERKMSAAFIDENQKYTGDMDEKDYKTVKTASKVAKTVGGAVWTMGGKKESEVGGIVGLGGVVGDQVAGEGYTVEMKFKCM